MTIWQIIIVICLYLITGGTVGYFIFRDDEEWVIVSTIFWPFIIFPIAIVWCLSLIGKLGKFLVVKIEKLFY